MAQVMRRIEVAEGKMALLAPSSPQTTIMSEWEFPKRKTRDGKKPDVGVFNSMGHPDSKMTHTKKAPREVANGR